MRTDAVHSQQCQREENALPQLFDAEEIRDCL
jgi:hypothetical protein